MLGYLVRWAFLFFHADPRETAARPASAVGVLPYNRRFELGAALAEAHGAGPAQPSALRQVLRARRRSVPPGLDHADRMCFVDIGNKKADHGIEFRCRRVA
jgi:hypothetical protein